MGINVYSHKMKVFILSSAITAYGGALYAFVIMFIEPNLFNWLESAKLIVITFVGGVNSITGAIITSVVYYSFGEFFRFVDVWRDVLLAVAVLFVTIFRSRRNFRKLGVLSEKNLPVERQGDILMEVLKVSDLSKNFGGVSAVAGFAMEQRENEITGIIGPNGAGKTTVFNLITGVYPVDSGKISFYGTEITRLPSHKITALGITRTFQNIRLFRNLTVLDNVKAAYGVKIHYTVWEEMVRYPTVRREEKKTEELARSYLSYFGMEKYSEFFPL